MTAPRTTLTLAAMGHVYTRATFTNMDDAGKRVEVNALLY